MSKKENHSTKMVMPGKTFETVDNKIAETEFFLRKMHEVGFNPQEFNWYFSAFLSAARTTSLALQQFKDEIPDFDKWYQPHQERLAASELAKVFLDMRNHHIHGGSYVVTGAVIEDKITKFFFPDRNMISEDVVTVSREYFLILLVIVYDCYKSLGVHIDSQQYLTKQHFKSMGKKIEDAEVEVWGFVRTSLKKEGLSVDDRWDELRTHADKCEINHLFYSYLGKVTPQPVVPDHYQDFDFTPEEKGWIHIPAGFNSLEAYKKAYGLPDPESN